MCLGSFFVVFKKSIVFLLVLSTFIILGIVVTKVYAGYVPPFGGRYTNLCGTGTSATHYSCSANCNINSGACSSGPGQYIYSFVCGGIVNECRSNELEYGPNNYVAVTHRAGVGSNQTVQIDVFGRKCRQGGQWVCNPSDLRGYIVWYSGASSGGGGGYFPPPQNNPLPTIRRNCGEPCTTTSECVRPYDGAFQAQCINNVCVNPICPHDTVPGSLCYCRNHTSRCGDKCGIWSDGFYPLCGDGISSCSWLLNTPQCVGHNATYCVPVNPANGYYLNQCMSDPSYRYLRRPDGTIANSVEDLRRACCSNSAPPPAEIIFPNGHTIYSNSVFLNYNVNNGWGSVCSQNQVNSHAVLVSAGCTNNYVNFGNISRLNNLLPNTEYCWIVYKSNGPTHSYSTVARFRTADNIQFNYSVALRNVCGTGWIGRSDMSNSSNPTSFVISGQIPAGLRLSYIAFSLVPVSNESRQFVSRDEILFKATQMNNANSVFFEISPVDIRLYRNMGDFSYSVLASSITSPFNNYIVRNPNFQVMQNSYNLSFSIEFLPNYRSDLYRVYAMSVFSDSANQQYSTYSFYSEGLIMYNPNGNIGSGIIGVDTIVPSIPQFSFTRFGTYGENIVFDNQVFMRASDNLSGINTNIRYMSIRSFDTNAIVRQNNLDMNVLNSSHPSFDVSQSFVLRNPSIFDPISPGNTYIFLNTDIPYEVRIGVSDSACNLSFYNTRILPFYRSWLISLGSNVYSKSGYRNNFIPQTALNLNYQPFNINYIPYFVNYGSIVGSSSTHFSNNARLSYLGYSLVNYRINESANMSFYNTLKELISKKMSIPSFNSFSISNNAFINRDSIGLVRNNVAMLRYFSAGTEDISFIFPSSYVGNQYFYGDWNGDGVDTLGVFIPNSRLVVLSNSNSNSNNYVSFVYGSEDFIFFGGDWNGDGIDTIGSYNKSTKLFYLKNTNSAGNADYVINFVVPNVNYDFLIPIAGDWNGDNIDTIGFFDILNAQVYLRNTNISGQPEIVYSFGQPGVNYKVATGDWSGQGFDNIALYNPLNSTILIKYSHDSSNLYEQISYGDPNLDRNSAFVAGKWINSNSRPIYMQYEPVNFIRSRNPDVIVPSISPFNLSQIFPINQNNDFLALELNKDVEIVGSVHCDGKYLIFIRGRLYINSYKITSSINGFCIFIASENIYIRSPLANTISSSPEVYYNLLEATFVTDKDIYINVEHPGATYLDNLLDARAILVRGSLIAKGKVYFNGRLDNTPDQNIFKPSFVVEYDPKVRLFFLQNQIIPRTVKVRDK